MNKYLVLSFVVAMALSATVIMAAGENKQISIQGRLTDTLGKPLTGSYQVIFNLYDAETGGTALWSEQQTVTTSNGLFQTRLGKNSQNSVLPTSLKFDKPYYVEITIGNEKLSPRYVLAASPYTISMPSSFDAAAITTGVLSASRLPTIDKISGMLVGPQIPSFDASKITTGTIAAARLPSIGSLSGSLMSSQIPNLDASKITTGTLAAARISSIDASAIGTGVLSLNRIPVLTADKLPTIDQLSGTLIIQQIPLLTAAKIPSLDASKITTGVFDAARLPTITSDKLADSSVTSAKIADGTVASADLSKKYKAGSFDFATGADERTAATIPSTQLGASASCACSVTAVTPDTANLANNANPFPWKYYCGCLVQPSDTNTVVHVFPRLFNGNAPTNTVTIKWLAIEA